MEHINYLFDSSPNGLLLFEPSAKGEGWSCIAANKSAGKLLGQTRTKGRMLNQLFPSQVAEKMAMTGESPGSNGVVHHLLNSSNRWLQAEVSQNKHRLTVALSDITLIKERSFADHHQMRLYKSLSNSLSDNEIILFDKDFNIVLSNGNPQFIRLGLEEDLKGKNLTTLLEGNAFTFLGEYVTKVFLNQRADVEREINGKFYKASIYSDGQQTDGAPEHVIGVLLLKDVSELNKKQQELELRVQQLDRSNRELQQFAYVASHDLQEPLRKIMSFGERLTRKYEAVLIGEGQEYITRMNNAAQRMETLINDLLSFSRVTRSDLPFEPTNLNHIFAYVIADMDAVERTKAQIDLPDQFPVIEAIPSQMRQLFQNLINNALKFVYMDRPPKVVVRCHNIQGSKLPEHLVLDPHKDYCMIEIEDNGIGFEQANAERIFTIFQRLHGRSEYGGTGVGLSICKKIVDHHQGAIFATGEEGKGAVFTVILPFKQGD